MSTTSKLSTCQIVCWGLASLAGLAVLVSATGSVGFLAALLLAVAFAAFLGLVFGRLICTGYSPQDRGIEAKDVEASLRQATGITGYKAPFDEDDDTPAPKPAATSAPAHAAEPTASAATAAPAVKTGTLLDGEEELSTRKGEWRYGEEAAPAAKQDGAEVGTRPATLSAPKDGKADDLKAIKGVGPKLEKLCNQLGFYHYDQIANWTAEEVAWVDENLKGFKGRVSRDGWVEQAKILAAGGETEFSRRVGEGDVY
ncbi:MAG: NADH:ubiquinone oxidoreductase [Alphaproteobacteria bacterium HGW-Alphaproteobacteria-1]|jgi:predicted flap endonuclease-1-like 5' DNA nuclease|nr:MAG: NADH:ubiquinone oxidoreductase [Alphaproteobacteria bacterium HGW-Alphaproteobacteria-1]